MKCLLVSRLGWLVAVITLALFPLFENAPAQNVNAAPPQRGPLSIPQAQLLQPEDLNHLLLTGGADKPLVLQVGSHVLYAEAHIPGSEYAGAGSQPEGLKQLQSKVNSLSRDKFIVLYCGCCPWSRCPNIEPAFKKLQEMGFTNVKVLYLADNFGANWVDKKYSVQKGR